MIGQEKRLRRCCFTEHRPEGIPLCELTAKDRLRYQIQQAIAASYISFNIGIDIDVSIEVYDTRRKKGFSGWLR